VDTTPDEEISITKLEPSLAELRYYGVSERLVMPTGPEIPQYDEIDENHGYPTAYGNFTKYGDVSPLLTGTDDKFVIIRPGDEIMLEFDEMAKEEGTGRSYYFYYAGLYKGYVAATITLGEEYLSTNPLPYGHPSQYPHNLSEYPYADDHDYQDYLSTWNTREIAYNESQAFAPIGGGREGGGLGGIIAIIALLLICALAVVIISHTPLPNPSKYLAMALCCLFFVGVYADAYAGITGKTTSEMQDISTFSSAGWDIAAVGDWAGETWKICDGEDYPRLGWEDMVCGG
jgi:hypothetical protein